MTCLAGKDIGRIKFALNATRIHFSNLIVVTTGHWLLGPYARRLGKPYNDFRRSCNDVEDGMIAKHLLCHCSVLSQSEFTDRQNLQIK